MLDELIKHIRTLNLKVIETLLTRALDLEIVETLDVPGRPDRRQPLPPELLSGPLKSALLAVVPDGLAWSHQSLALRRLLQHENVVVATGTASGKSLIFQSVSFHRVCEDHQAKVLVFYPLKALASDQHARWLEMATAVGLGPSAIVRIDGDMLMTDRLQALDDARVVLMTPDVCQSWLMRNVGTGIVRRFLERLALVVLDEAHVYESVFGSNVAFLLRRMISAKRQATQKAQNRRLQIVAATATIRDPADHLNRLTGLNFSVVEEQDNGAPFYPRTIIHVNGSDHRAAGETKLTDLARGVRELSCRRRFIAFMDSRQGVERVVRQLNDPGVLPYRSGYEAEDRKRIERALRDGTLDGVVSTSALELGIDITDMEIGINLGVPESRKAFRQRIGRIGRSGPGIFFVIAPPGAFRKFGETFKDYYDGSVEPSYLYLGNRFIQFAHARCLLREMENLADYRGSLPARVDWPDGFDSALKLAKPGAGYPCEFDFIAQIGADEPHHNYPLRNVGEANFEIKEGTGDYQLRIGKIATNQAVREAYPGATYLHLGRAYKVQEWKTRNFERSIQIMPSTKPAPTRPILRKTATFGLAPDGIVEAHIKSSHTGFVAEVHLQVNESVEGYKIGNTTFLYKELRAKNPNMSRKQRDFRTSGVVLRIEEPWFAGMANAEVRGLVAKGLLGLISRDRSISPRDIDETHNNIAMATTAGPKRLTDAIVIYDAVYGGLRLTEDLFIEFERYCAQLRKAADLAGGDAIVNGEIATQLFAWTKNVGSGHAEAGAAAAIPDGWFQIYKPGSLVSVLFNGNFVEREIILPKLADPLNTGVRKLFYDYRSNGGRCSVPHDKVRATGQDWSWGLWNPDTNEFRDLDEPAVDDGIGAQIDWQGAFAEVYRPPISNSSIFCPVPQAARSLDGLR
jgi:DEAD/DEAH box helicase domain-containing protein